MMLSGAPAVWGTWPQPFARLDPDSRTLATALSISIVFHAIVLSIHFKLPERLSGLTASQLEVILVNSKTRSRPAEADVLAQADLDGGGDTDLDRRAKSPLPVLQPPERGADLRQTQRKVQEMEAQQRQLLSQLQSANEIPSAEPEPRADEKSQVSGADLADSALIIARMEAQIARQIDEYNKRARQDLRQPPAHRFDQLGWHARRDGSSAIVGIQDTRRRRAADREARRAVCEISPGHPQGNRHPGHHAHLDFRARRQGLQRLSPGTTPPRAPRARRHETATLPVEVVLLRRRDGGGRPRHLRIT